MNKSAFQTPVIGNTFNKIVIRRGFLFGLLIMTALIAFEIFNYSTTEYALEDLLGNLNFAKINWATILAIAFCGIDFAGIARIFTPESGSNEKNEVWYLFGAWLLAATMNAALTWWAVSIALLQHQSLGNYVINQQMLIRIVPLFVAIMVWLIRILLIGTFSIAGDRLFSQESYPLHNKYSHRLQKPVQNQTEISQSSSYRPMPKPFPQSENMSYARQEPTYHPVAMSGKTNNNSQVRR